MTGGIRTLANTIEDIPVHIAKAPPMVSPIIIDIECFQVQLGRIKAFNATDNKQRHLHQYLRHVQESQVCP
jgi:hypothetical protein